MIKAFVKIGENGYVNEWVAPREDAGYLLIEADESLVNNLDCVKVEDGIATLDKEKQEELQEENKDLLELLEEERKMYE
ncbi:hypothetical protein HB904_03820 [Listeria booriae]|uniref:Uncharacterized protein n=1 Tax=Listeria booriae TaxID=1552123 RepID=A0A842ABH2_9LIST|nr:hypothetical protein [Listeria booriae]MBC1615299.1 hypothetical protein [Listeria booriae]MBC1913073.1 hypothetical protein [Listeria booriae]